MASFLERQFKKLPKPVKKAVRTGEKAIKIKASKALEKIAEPASKIVARETKKAGMQSIGPWIATSAIVLALIFVSRGKK